MLWQKRKKNEKKTGFNRFKSVRLPVALNQATKTTVVVASCPFLGPKTRPDQTLEHYWAQRPWGFSSQQQVNSTPPLSDQNHFSILSVDSISEMDEPVETPKVIQTLKNHSCNPWSPKNSKTPFGKTASISLCHWHFRWDRRDPSLPHPESWTCDYRHWGC